MMLLSPPAPQLEQPRPPLRVAPVLLDGRRGESTLDRRHRAVRLSCVVPCFNEAANIDRLLPRLQQALIGLGGEWEIVLVDDGSSDGTAQLLGFLGTLAAACVAFSCRATSARRPR